MLKKNQIDVDLTSEDDIKSVLELLISDTKLWSKLIDENKGLLYGQIVDGGFESYGEDAECSEEIFFASAVKFSSLHPLIVKYIESVDANEWYYGESHLGMTAAFTLALYDESYIPLFIGYHRNIRPGGGLTQLGQIVNLLSRSDNGLRLLAACCTYQIDNQDIEYNIEDWMSEYVESKEQQEKLFGYILEEVRYILANGSATDYLLEYVIEALDIMGVDYDEEIVEDVLSNFNDRFIVNNQSFPSLSGIVS